jgi:hypothetical protein
MWQQQVTADIDGKQNSNFYLNINGGHNYVTLNMLNNCFCLHKNTDEGYNYIWIILYLQLMLNHPQVHRLINQLIWVCGLFFPVCRAMSATTFSSWRTSHSAAFIRKTASEWGTEPFIWVFHRHSNGLSCWLDFVCTGWVSNRGKRTQ